MPRMMAPAAALTRADAEDGGGEEEPPWNWVKKLQTTPEVQVRRPSHVHPSIGPGSWPPPSNAAQTTGYPVRHPE
ncbi:hypothetical protein [Actinomadura sp. DC4]|uniref:hypothetical protein n=1 Tax=Actinomadura sp. DC4 TaxID=3055069 RepID=UPI0025B11CFD|nr:hypothetical protein [Actinomadura sp. DC4]MDN3355756.1 hypothetical protein [Actinomadura sp. DC4]